MWQIFGVNGFLPSILSILSWILYAGIVFILLKLAPVAYFFLRKELLANLSVHIETQPLSLPPAGSSIVIFAPHPDDDIIACGGFIQQATKRGCRITVVFLSSGDGMGKIDRLLHRGGKPEPEHFRKMALRRMGEAKTALHMIGLADSNIIFLGFPDGCLQRLWWNHWNKSDPYTSPYTDSASVIYRDAYEPGAPYAGSALVELVERILSERSPQCIVYPHFYDLHGDHYAAKYFVKLAIARARIEAVELTYLVHHETWPLPHGRFPKMRLHPPRSLSHCRTQWRSLDLTNEELVLKEKCLDAHETQLTMKIYRRYLMSFLRANEIFGICRDASFERILLDVNASAYPVAPFAFTLVENPFGVHLLSLLYPAATIGDVAIVVQDGFMTIMMQTHRSPQPRFRYVMHLVLLSGDREAGRMTVSVHHNRLTIDNSYDGPTHTLQEGSSMSRAFNHYRVSMPIVAMPAFDRLLFNAVSHYGEAIVDRTSIRLAQFSSDESEKNPGSRGSLSSN